jgi:GrpB-like predicted nucleotidyltransferase (UPF0157 family)
MVRHTLFRDWLVAHPEDRRRYADAEHAATTGGPALVGLRYNQVKEPVVHEIYRRMFRAAALLP